MRSTPARNLDNLQWRDPPPDEEGYWWLRSPHYRPFAIWCRGIEGENLGPDLADDFITPDGWASDCWQCAQVVLPQHYDKDQVSALLRDMRGVLAAFDDDLLSEQWEIMGHIITLMGRRGRQ